MNIRKFFLIILLLTGFSRLSLAQEKEPGAREPGKNYWYGLTGRDSLTITKVWTASLLLPGYSQAYNRDYWKIPVVWGGIGGLIGAGVHSHRQYKATGEERFRQQRTWFYLGAAAVYWSSLLDGAVSYKTAKSVLPARAALYSTMLPGLGQIYNGDYWKLPVLYGGLAFTGYLIDFNNKQYLRFRKAYDILRDGDPDTVDEFNGRFTEANLKYYRDSYRRSRDYAILFTALVYVMNIIDANVFAHLKNFDVDDNLSLRIHPALLNYDAYASGGQPAIGMQLQITF
ncbi:MAG: DUF5683 domain-containing protein [Prevotellaceae bacterium]|nr:DUF5683 domain-containing protein [Prevotellaceae bacterium]